MQKLQAHWLFPLRGLQLKNKSAENMQDWMKRKAKEWPVQ